MKPETLTERADRILKATANLKQALQYIEAEARQLLKDVAEANQLSLFEDDVNGS